MERERYPRNIEPNLARNGMASTPSSAAGEADASGNLKKAAHLERAVQSLPKLAPWKTAPGNAQRSQSKIRLKLHKRLSK